MQNDIVSVALGFTAGSSSPCELPPPAAGTPQRATLATVVPTADSPPPYLLHDATGAAAGMYVSDSAPFLTLKQALHERSPRGSVAFGRQWSMQVEGARSDGAAPSASHTRCQHASVEASAAGISDPPLLSATFWRVDFFVASWTAAVGALLATPTAAAGAVKSTKSTLYERGSLPLLQPWEQLRNQLPADTHCVRLWATSLPTVLQQARSKQSSSGGDACKSPSRTATTWNGLPSNGNASFCSSTASGPTTPLTAKTSIKFTQSTLSIPIRELLAGSHEVTPNGRGSGSDFLATRALRVEVLRSTLNEVALIMLGGGAAPHESQATDTSVLASVTYQNSIGIVGLQVSWLPSSATSSPPLSGKTKSTSSASSTGPSDEDSSSGPAPEVVARDLVLEIQFLTQSSTNAGKKAIEAAVRELLPAPFFEAPSALTIGVANQHDGSVTNITLRSPSLSCKGDGAVAGSSSSTTTAPPSLLHNAWTAAVTGGAKATPRDAPPKDDAVVSTTKPPPLAAKTLPARVLPTPLAATATAAAAVAKGETVATKEKRVATPAAVTAKAVAAKPENGVATPAATRTLPVTTPRGLGEDKKLPPVPKPAEKKSTATAALNKGTSDKEKSEGGAKKSSRKSAAAAGAAADAVAPASSGLQSTASSAASLKSSASNPRASVVEEYVSSLEATRSEGELRVIPSPVAEERGHTEDPHPPSPLHPQLTIQEELTKQAQLLVMHALDFGLLRMQFEELLAGHGEYRPNVSGACGIASSISTSLSSSCMSVTTTIPLMMSAAPLVDATVLAASGDVVRTALCIFRNLCVAPIETAPGFPVKAEDAAFEATVGPSSKMFKLAVESGSAAQVEAYRAFLFNQKRLITDAVSAYGILFGFSDEILPVFEQELRLLNMEQSSWQSIVDEATYSKKNVEAVLATRAAEKRKSKLLRRSHRNGTGSPTAATAASEGAQAESAKSLGQSCNSTTSSAAADEGDVAASPSPGGGCSTLGDAAAAPHAETGPRNHKVSEKDSLPAPAEGVPQQKPPRNPSATSPVSSKKGAQPIQSTPRLRGRPLSHYMVAIFVAFAIAIVAAALAG